MRQSAEAKDERRVDEPAHVVAKAEDRRPLRRLVCAKALEHGDSVVEARRQKRQRRLCRRHQPRSARPSAQCSHQHALFRPRDHRMDERHHGAQLRADLLDRVLLLPRRREPGTARFVFRDPLAHTFRQ